jgi:hypothetical protein
LHFFHNSWPCPSRRITYSGKPQPASPLLDCFPLRLLFAPCAFQTAVADARELKPALTNCQARFLHGRKGESCAESISKTQVALDLLRHG